MLEIFEAALAHEEKVSESIRELYRSADKEGDYDSRPLLNWFVDEQIEETKARTAGAGSAMFLLTSAGEVNAYGPDSRFVNIVFDLLGFESAADVQAEGTHGEAVSFEAISAADPDHLFVLDRDTAIGQSGGEAAQQVLDNELVDGTTAAQQDRITYVDSASWYLVGLGLDNFPAMIDEVQESLS